MSHLLISRFLLLLPASAPPKPPSPSPRSTTPPLHHVRLHHLAHYIQAPCFLCFFLHTQCIESDASAYENSASNSASDAAGSSADSAESSESETISLRGCSNAFPAPPRTRAQRAPGRRHAPRTRGRRALRRVDIAMLRGRVSWTLGHHGMGERIPRRPRPTRPAFEPLNPDLMSSVALTGTNHAEDEAMYLRVMRGVDGPAPSAVDALGAKANVDGEKGSVDA
ncbi:hypothetical protein DFH09DRAFT_1316422 [Mycena vulgaris]|nr:hypothetical protein DFH09DRAFT_1316422 [Mycena vulgaris]